MNLSNIHFYFLIKCISPNIVMPISLPISLLLENSLNPHPRICFLIDFKERERERDRDKHRCERETLIGLLPICAPTGD